MPRKKESISAEPAAQEVASSTLLHESAHEQDVAKPPQSLTGEDEDDDSDEEVRREYF